MTRHGDHRPRPRTWLLVAGVLVLSAGAVAGGYAGTRAVRTHLDHPAGQVAGPVPSEVGAATATPATTSGSVAPGAGAAPIPVAAAVAAAVGAVIGSTPLAAGVLADVLDAQTGQVLYARHATGTAAPASTAKVLTAAAAFTTPGPTARIDTQLRVGADGTAYLIGAGDPTLSAAPAGTATTYPDAARLSDLAAAVATAHTVVHRIVIDDSAFSGPAISPNWAPGDVPSDYASAITAVLADGGRSTPDAPVRSATPDLDAGRRLAALLGAPGLPVSRGAVPADVPVLASVRSAPISELVDQMLQNSDNVIAECLARQVAIAAHGNASFTGAAAAVRGTLAGLGVDPGSGLVDASGLAAIDRLSANSLTAVLRMIVATGHPQLHGIVSALPVAGWSGTLGDRYLSGSGATAGAGRVRAKTGTLTGVSTLAGIVHDADGRLLVFALLADRVAGTAAATVAAEAALDRVAATLARCGCP